jgi:predicted  nucleic acid-binding Zn-ribbon protein
MTHSASAPDPAVTALQRKLTDCLSARAADWASFRERQHTLETNLREAAGALKEHEGTIERLRIESRALTRELEHLNDAEARLRQAQVRITQLERQEAGYREEIERLSHDQSTTEALCDQLRQHEQQLQGLVQELQGKLQQTREQLSAFSEPWALQPEALFQLLRASAGLEPSLSPRLQAHLAEPTAVALEALYALVRLQNGRPFSDLVLSERLSQALEEHRKRG